MAIHKKIYNKFLSNIRINEIIKKLNPLLKDSKNVLDVGCGNGRISSLLIKNNSNLNIQGIDVIPIENPKIPLKLFDGKNIPFKDNTFDIVMIIDALHHAEDMKKIIKECIRVSKKYIIIKDHYYNTKLDYSILKLYDYIGNKPFGVNLPYNYKKTKEWKKIILDNNLKSIYLKEFRYKMQPGKQIIMKLEKM